MSANELSPLDQLLQHDFKAVLSSESESGCLLLISAQTGIGKTHTIKNTILQELIQVVSGQSESRLIYYITNSVDNVSSTHQELLTLIDSTFDESRPSILNRQSLKNHIVYLPNQSAQLLSMSECDVDYVINRFELTGYSALIQDWKALKAQRQVARDYPAIYAEFSRDLESKAGKIYSQLISYLQSRQKSASAITLSDQDKRILDDLIPGDRLRRGDACVVFMTTKKFLSGYKTLTGTIHPTRELGNALLLIDEVDRQNEVILQTMADQQVIDLIELIRTLYANIPQYKLEQSPRYQDMQSAFDELAESLTDFAERWQLQYAFNIDGASLDQERVRLFSDRTVTHVHSARHTLHLKTHTQLQKNLIHSSNGNPANSFQDNITGTLSRFINEADWLFRRFIYLIRSSIWTYSHHASCSRHSKVPTQQEAVVSVLQHLNLQDLSSLVFDALDAQVSFTGRKGITKAEQRNIVRAYHDSGLKLTEVSLNDDAVDTVGCFYTGLALTPSGLLARLVEGGAKIVGVSATATVDTVIKNFDLSYLKTRLGSQFIELNTRQRHYIGKYYRARRQYSERGVAIKPEFLQASRAELTKLLEAYTGKKIRHPESLLANWLGRDSNDDGMFILSWLSRLVQAIERFVASADNRYMLVLLNRVIHPSKHRGLVDFLSWLTSQGSTKPTQLFSGVDAQFLKQGRFEQVQQALTETMDKVIVLSTYATMGEGKNPDYLVSQTEDLARLIWVGQGAAPSAVKADIDTLYLERPTHQLLSSDCYHTNQLLQLHQILSLQERGYISPLQARAWSHQFLIEGNHINNLRQYYMTDDYVALIQKILEQAIGRTARTAFKCSNISIMVDDDAAKALVQDHRTAETLSLEYAALRDFAQSYMQDPSFDDRQALQRRNRAKLFTAGTISQINEFLSGFKGVKAQFAISGWEQLRRQLLIHPTAQNPVSEYPRLYLQAPSANEYQFSGNLDHCNEFSSLQKDWYFFDELKANRWVSESDSGLFTLMKNSTIEQYFDLHGYAKRWQSSCWIMNPAAFFNLYKAALGEESIKAILRDSGCLIEALPGTVYEECDFIVRLTAHSEPIAVDAKHWQNAGDAKRYEQKLQNLNAALGVERFAYINLFGRDDGLCRNLSRDFTLTDEYRAPVLEVSGLVDRESGATLVNHLNRFLLWMRE